MAANDNSTLNSRTYTSNLAASGRTPIRLSKRIGGKARSLCYKEVVKHVPTSLTDRQHFNTLDTMVPNKPEAHVQVIQMRAIDTIFITAPAK